MGTGQRAYFVKVAERKKNEQLASFQASVLKAYGVLHTVKVDLS
jgi:hypothetical protein